MARTKYTETEQQLSSILVTELLAHQFCFPVKWVETQDVMLNEFGSERVVEIGPADTLVRMMEKTLQAGYKAHDAALGLERELLSYKRQSDALYFKFQQASEPTPAPAKVTAAATVTAAVVAPVAATTPAIVVQAAAVTASASIPDIPVSALNKLRTLVAIALKRDRSEIENGKSIKQLSGGRSTVQNEIIGDLTKEFTTLPDQAEELSLEELGAALAHHKKLGPLALGLLGKLASAKLPAGSSLTTLKQYTQTRWGFGEGLQETAMLSVLSKQPAARLPSEKDVHAFMDEMASQVLADAGIDPKSIGAASGGATAAAATAISSEALKDLQKIQQKQDRQMLQIYAKRCEFDLEGNSHSVEVLNNTVQDLQNQLNLWNTEHGEFYGEGIAPKFDPRKVRKFNSSWNWVIQDLFELVPKQFEMESVASVEELARRVSQIEGRATPRLIAAIKHMTKECLKTSSLNKPSPVLQLLEQLCQQFEISLAQEPVFKPSAFPTAPIVSVTESGAIEYTEIPRVKLFPENSLGVGDRKGSMFNDVFDSGYNTPMLSRVSSAAMSRSSSMSSLFDVADIPLPQQSPPFVRRQSAQPIMETPFIKSKRAGEWARDEIVTNGYLEWFESSSTEGTSFRNRSVLVTGAGKGSIGAEIVQMLLSAGAKVVVTTSSYSPEVVKFFQRMYKEHGGRDSQLMLVPFNGGSQQDINNVVEYIYNDTTGLGWDLDHVIPFAAVGEAGRAIDRIDSKSELAHRVMCTNVIRLMGAIKAHKERQRIETHPTQVILPLSPNHGIFGQDGLYAESKLGLEGLLNKWWSEDWGQYLSLCGAVIGWTRGTGLMAGNDTMAAGVESMNIRTFSKGEMGLHILGLMQPPVASFCECEPLIADISGGLGTCDDLRVELDRIQEAIKTESGLKRAIAEDARLDRKVVSGPPPASRKRKINQRANIQSSVHKLPEWNAEIEPLTSELSGMVDLERVVVAVGFGESGPYGNSRTRWQVEVQGGFSIDGCLEMAWIMGLIKYHRGPLQGRDYCGWLDVKTGEPIEDSEVKNKYESYINEHTGIRMLERSAHDQEESDQKSFLQEVAVTEDLEPFEVSSEAAQDFKREHGDKVTVIESEDGQTFISLKAGATLMIPKAAKYRHAVGAQMPTGWDPKVYGIPADIISQVDPVTLYSVVSTIEAFLSAGITDPYELYSKVHVSEVGLCVGSGMGGATSLHRMFKQRFLDRQVQKDILAETFINTTSAWINMLLLGGAGPIKTPVGACATALESVDSGFEMITSGKVKACLVGGFDKLERDTAAEFANMKATVNVENELLAGRVPREMSRPTSSSRGGFVEGEGSGIQLLTTAQLALEMGLPIQGIIALTHMAGDKIGRSVPAPGTGLLTIAKETPSKFPSPLLNMSYRRRLLEMRKEQINAQREAELMYLEEFAKENSEISTEERRSDIEAGARRSIKDTLNAYGNNFYRDETRISPLRGALAVWGLTIDDITVASLHGTSTVLNDLNETSVIQQQFTHLGRSKGNVMPVVCQKSLVGHAKGAAAAFALNGCFQMMATNQVPGNPNADNIDGALAENDHLFFPDRTLNLRGGIKAFMVTSFGFGQKGAQVVGVHPRYLFATISKEQYASYCGLVETRMEKARRFFEEGFYGNKLVQVKDKAPYDASQTSKVLMDASARF